MWLQIINLIFSSFVVLSFVSCSFQLNRKEFNSLGNTNRKTETINVKELSRNWWPICRKKHNCRKTQRDVSERCFFITVGRLISERRKNDLAFNSKYGEWIDMGYLVPDKEVNPMVAGCYEQGKKAGHDLFYFDGWDRNPNQVLEAQKLGVLNPSNSVVVLLHADRSTCHKRMIHRRENRSGGPRKDDKSDKSFNRRWNIYAQNFIRVRKEIVNTGVRFCRIDASQDLSIVTNLALGVAMELKPIQGFRVLTPVLATATV